jgi:hypothetical protein
MKLVGKPDAGNRHARFDERGWETGRCRMAQATAPILDSAIRDIARSQIEVRFRCKSGHTADITAMTGFDPTETSPAKFAVMHNVAFYRQRCGKV